ncbi:MAG TPA: SpoIIE family protein phosphatase [Streptosporangiaceae bacterium]
MDDTGRAGPARQEPGGEPFPGQGEMVLIGERWLAALQDLSALAGRARSAADASRLVSRALAGAARDIPFAAVYLRDPGTGEAVLTASTGPGAAPGPLASGPGDWPVGQVLRTGQPVTVTDVAHRFGDLPSGGGETSPAQAMVLPLHGEVGAPPVGVMVLAASAGRALDEAYRSFLGLVAQQTAALVNGAVAYQVQQRRAEELIELDRARTTFFSNISHEFRTPLTLIMGPLEELRARLAAQDQTVRQELDVMHRNGLRLGKLVNTLLDFSRIEAGRTQARYEPVELAAFTADLASVFRSAVERAGLAYQVDCPRLPQPVYVDQEMWEKVVLNLLSNALKFTFEGSISVTLRPDGDHALLRVTDTGVGVAAEEMPRLFERFHQIPHARSRSNEGSGIGLALVRELVDLHGGTISAESTEGTGTRFTIRLPFGRDHLPADHVADAAAPSVVSALADPFLEEAQRWLPEGGRSPGALPAVAPEPAVAWAGTGGPARVLLADDNADMREYLQRLLQVRYEVTTVADGLTALDSVRADAPDLVISDVMMPGLDGLALVAALRCDPRTADVPVLLLSARAGQEAAIEGLEAGADDYLVKPFLAAELLARVRANVELSRLRTHHARWRAALIDSLHEAFFLCDKNGAVTEINAAFTDILGYGPEGLPYPAEHAWWPRPDTDPEAYRQVSQAFGNLMEQSRGSFIAPVTHKDGHRLWVAASFSQVQEPDTGARVVVGTLRDVTAEHYAGQREAALAAMGMLLSQATNLPQALQGALHELRRLWHARRALAVTWDGGDEPALVSTGPETGWDQLPVPLREAISALRQRPVLTPAGSGDGGPSAGSGGGGPSAGITVGHPRGLLAIWIELDPGRPFGAEDRALLALLCGYLGQALHRVHQSDQQRQTALALQRAILGPARLPAGFAARYQPASRPLEVGGDWFDIVELPDGRTGIVVGDCVGHGLEAATVMGQLRSACRALLLQDASAAQTLTAMDRFAALIPDAICSTVFCGILDPGAGRMAYSSAGHPPGILARPDGRIELLDGGRSFPLAVRPGIVRAEASCAVPPRATLLLYTDGLVERRRQSINAGIARAGTALLDGGSAGVEELAGELMTTLAPQGGYEDDVAFVVYRHPAPLDLSFPADSAQLAPVRATLRDWLSRCGLSHRTAQDVLVAAGEACANAIEHGHRHAPGAQVRLWAATTVSQLRLTVTDSGRWEASRPDRDPPRGHGIPLMRALMQHVSIEPGPAGTTVEMRVDIAS